MGKYNKYTISGENWYWVATSTNIYKYIETTSNLRNSHSFSIYSNMNPIQLRKNLFLFERKTYPPYHAPVTDPQSLWGTDLITYFHIPLFSY